MNKKLKVFFYIALYVPIGINVLCWSRFEVS